MKDDSKFMYCREIKPGMIFDWPRYRPALWKVTEEGKYYLQEGKRIRIDNSRKNKWWCQPVDGSGPPMLCCFSEVFGVSLWNFRWPEVDESDWMNAQQ